MDTNILYATKNKGFRIYHIYQDCSRLKYAKQLIATKKASGYICYDCNLRKRKADAFKAVGVKIE